MDRVTPKGIWIIAGRDGKPFSRQPALEQPYYWTLKRPELALLHALLKCTCLQQLLKLF